MVISLFKEGRATARIFAAASACETFSRTKATRASRFSLPRPRRNVRARARSSFAYGILDAQRDSADLWNETVETPRERESGT